MCQINCSIPENVPFDKANMAAFDPLQNDLLKLQRQDSTLQALEKEHYFYQKRTEKLQSVRHKTAFVEGTMPHTKHISRFPPYTFGSKYFKISTNTPKFAPEASREKTS